MTRLCKDLSKWSEVRIDHASSRRLVSVISLRIAHPFSIISCYFVDCAGEEGHLEKYSSGEEQLMLGLDEIWRKAFIHMQNTFIHVRWMLNLFT